MKVKSNFLDPAIADILHNLDGLGRKQSMILKAENICKSYGDLKVLKNVNVAVDHKEIVVISGKSGAGKSTLLHILGTLDRPDTGNLDMEGAQLDSMSDNELSDFRNREIGFVFQFHYLLNEFTALENVMIPGFIKKENEKKLRTAALDLLKLMGLGARIDNKPNQLSGGEQQRVAVARALINKPKIIFADEPTGNLDSHNSEDLYELFFNLRASRGQSFVIVTHNEHFASMSDRRIVMEDGKIISP